MPEPALSCRNFPCADSADIPYVGTDWSPPAEPLPDRELVAEAGRESIILAGELPLRRRFLSSRVAVDAATSAARLRSTKELFIAQSSLSLLSLTLSLLSKERELRPPMLATLLLTLLVLLTHESAGLIRPSACPSALSLAAVSRRPKAASVGCKDSNSWSASGGRWVFLTFPLYVSRTCSSEVLFADESSSFDIAAEALLSWRSCRPPFRSTGSFAFDFRVAQSAFLGLCRLALPSYAPGKSWACADDTGSGSCAVEKTNAGPTPMGGDREANSVRETADARGAVTLSAVRLGRVGSGLCECNTSSEGAPCACKPTLPRASRLGETLGDRGIP